MSKLPDKITNQRYTCNLCDGTGFTPFAYKDFDDLVRENQQLKRDQKEKYILWRGKNQELKKRIVQKDQEIQELKEKLDYVATEAYNLRYSSNSTNMINFTGMVDRYLNLNEKPF